jgi:hypothetical protein
LSDSGLAAANLARMVSDAHLLRHSFNHRYTHGLSER